MGDVSFELYKTFVAVAKVKNMTKAAEDLMVSQPAVSKAIKTLEGQLGVALFNRSSLGLELTKEGELLYERIMPSIETLKNAENIIEEFKTLNTGEIKIGISSVLTKCILIDILSVFCHKYPKINIIIKNGLTSDLLKDLRDGKLDFVIYNKSNIDENGVDVTELTKLKQVFFVNPAFFNVNVLKIEDLNNYPLILQNKSSNTRKLLDSYTNDCLNPTMEVVSQDLICHFVVAGFGIGFAFEKLVKDFDMLKIIDIEVPDVSINLARNKTDDMSYAAKVLIKELKK